uniref:NADH-ubiquinone oxidoreductase chain 4 n=1 Tax=Ebrechtella tricuspidata TaxID=1112414 RepID=A0A1U7AFR5_9ARAC|nr:NADH dehydrogenase subunit 4 [Ebrechtella tricuspidata]
MLKLVLISLFNFHLNNHTMIFISSLIILFILLKMTNFNMYAYDNYFFNDNISLMLITLTLMSFLLIIMVTDYFNKMIKTMMPIMITLLLVFSTSNMLLFYIMFEIVLIPTMILIMSLGKQPERLQASIYLMVYTIVASLPLLMVIILMMFNKSFMTNLILLNNINMMLPIIIAFLVKSPMFLSHLWLPKAHVEAPVEGSMILAAVLLKLGGYGLIRFSPLLYAKIIPLNFWISSISLIGAIMTSMNCIRQKDLKSLIAYSSVAHMGLVLASIMTLNFIGFYGAILMMVAHGLSSSALFLMVNMIYTKHHTRNIISFKGLWNSFPNITFWWFVFIAANISAPPSINLAGEIFILMSLINLNILILIPFIFISLMTSIFSITLFLNTVHNQPNSILASSSSNKLYLCLFLHLFPLIAIISKLDISLF